MNMIPFSNNTMSWIIQNMSDGGEASIIGRIKNSKFFAIQIDKSTDVAYFTVLLDIVRYFALSSSARARKM